MGCRGDAGRAGSAIAAAGIIDTGRAVAQPPPSRFQRCPQPYRYTVGSSDAAVGISED